MRKLGITRSSLIVACAIAAIGASGCSGGGASVPPALPTAGAPAPNTPGLVSVAAPKITEIPIAAGDSAPTAIAIASDGNPWFLSSNAVNRLSSTTGAISQFTEPRFTAYNASTDIIRGPDNQMWFTANCGIFEAQGPCDGAFEVKIVRSTLSGTFTIVAPGGETSEGAFQSGLTPGADNTVWALTSFAATASTNGGAYSQVRTDGTTIIPETPLPSTCFSMVPRIYIPEGIARGNDGAIYIAATSPCAGTGVPEAVSAVLRINTAGVVTNTFTVPDVQRITAGVDGNLWVTQGGTTNAIGRLTPSGSLTEFHIPTANAGPMGITQGNDGAIWFTESQASKVGRITLDGAITEYPTPTHTTLYGIASLPNECGPGHGDMWFTETSAGRIGRITF